MATIYTNDDLIDLKLTPGSIRKLMCLAGPRQTANKAINTTKVPEKRIALVNFLSSKVNKQTAVTANQAVRKHTSFVAAKLEVIFPPNTINNGKIPQIGPSPKYG